MCCLSFWDPVSCRRLFQPLFANRMHRICFKRDPRFCVSFWREGFYCTYLFISMATQHMAFFMMCFFLLAHKNDARGLHPSPRRCILICKAQSKTAQKQPACRLPKRLPALVPSVPEHNGIWQPSEILAAQLAAIPQQIHFLSGIHSLW